MDTRRTTNLKGHHATAEQLRALLAGTLGAEARGRLNAHLQCCTACRSHYAEMRAKPLPASTEQLSQQTMPRPPDWILQRRGLLTPEGGFDLARLRTLEKHGIVWAREQLERIRAAFQAALVVWLLGASHRQARAGRTRSGALGQSTALDAEEEQSLYKDATVVDRTGHAQPQPLRLTVVQPPTILPNGELVCMLWTDDARADGGTVQCTVTAVENVKVTFTGMLQPLLQHAGWVAIVRAPDFPARPEPVTIPLECLEVTIQRDGDTEAPVHPIDFLVPALRAQDVTSSSLAAQLWVEPVSTRPTRLPWQEQRSPGNNTQDGVHVFAVGDLVRIGMSVSQDAYLTLVNVTPAGTITQIMPSTMWPTQQLQRGQELFIPPQDGTVGLPIEGPSGLETMVLLASVVPFPISAPDILQLVHALTRRPADQWVLRCIQWLVVE